MLDNINGVTKAVSKHPYVTSGSIALLSAAAGLAYVMWDKNRRLADHDNNDQEFSDSEANSAYASSDRNQYGEELSKEGREHKRSKIASIWLGAGFAFSAVLGAALYYRYSAKPNAFLSRLPSPADLASTSMSHINNRFNTIKHSANSVYENLAKKAANIRY